MKALELDRTERKQMVQHLINQICDGNVGPDRGECWDSLCRYYGERYGFEEGDLNSEFESVIDEGIDGACKILRPHTRTQEEA